MRALLSEPGLGQRRAAKHCPGANGHASSELASAAVTNSHFPWEAPDGKFM
jgi:hypothetical protein